MKRDRPRAPGEGDPPRVLGEDGQDPLLIALLAAADADDSTAEQCARMVEALDERIAIEALVQLGGGEVAEKRAEGSFQRFPRTAHRPRLERSLGTSMQGTQR